MASELIFIVQESPEGGFEARALEHSIFAEGDTWEEMRDAVRDAVACHFEGTEAPHIVRLHLVKEELLAL